MTSADEPPPAPGPSSRRRPLVLAAVAALALAAVVAVGVVASRDGDDRRTTPPASTADRQVVIERSGDGDEETAAFKVRDGWEIRWETSGESFQVSITGDRDFGKVIDQKGPGGGSTYPVGSGTFRLVVKAKGSWSVSVLNH